MLLTIEKRKQQIASIEESIRELDSLIDERIEELQEEHRARRGAHRTP
jgi:hypothetical protein